MDGLPVRPSFGMTTQDIRDLFAYHSPFKDCENVVINYQDSLTFTITDHFSIKWNYTPKTDCFLFIITKMQVVTLLSILYSMTTSIWSYSAGKGISNVQVNLIPYDSVYKSIWQWYKLMIILKLLPDYDLPFGTNVGVPGNLGTNLSQEWT